MIDLRAETRSEEIPKKNTRKSMMTKIDDSVHGILVFALIFLMIGKNTNDSMSATTTGRTKDDIVLHSVPARTHAKKSRTKKDAL